MSGIDYRAGQLCCDEVPLTDLAEQHGTPLFVYSANRIAERWQEYAEALPDGDICYAVKANANLSLLAYLHQLGAHFDVVSGGELERVLAVGVPPAHIHFAGVGKSEAELRLATEKQIGCICLESLAESERLLEVAGRLKLRPRIAIRINPSIEADTHHSIQTGGGNHKFGIAADQALSLAQQLMNSRQVELVGISCHIGSQILSIPPFISAAKHLRYFYLQLAKQGHQLSFISMGGGFGIAYQEGERRLEPERWQKIRAVFDDLPVRLVAEPGRSLVADAGGLVTRIEYIKQAPLRQFIIVDAAMNDLPRPSLYDAYHRVQAVLPRQGDEQTYDIVGPICESGDWLARRRRLCVRQGDLLCLMDTGAYSMAMSSNYNSRNRAAEVLVQGDQAKLIRRRQTIKDQWQLEWPPQSFDKS